MRYKYLCSQWLAEDCGTGLCTKISYDFLRFTIEQQREVYSDDYRIVPVSCLPACLRLSTKQRAPTEELRVKSVFELCTRITSGYVYTHEMYGVTNALLRKVKIAEVRLTPWRHGGVARFVLLRLYALYISGRVWFCFRCYDTVSGFDLHTFFLWVCRSVHLSAYSSQSFLISARTVSTMQSIL